MRTRIAVLVPVLVSIAIAPSPWHLVAVAIAIFYVYRYWEDSPFLTLLTGLSMVTAYFFVEHAWLRAVNPFAGERFFYVPAWLSGVVAWGLYHVGVGLVAVATYLLFAKLLAEAVSPERAQEVVAYAGEGALPAPSAEPQEETRKEKVRTMTEVAL